MFSHLVNVLLGEWTLGAVLFGYKSVFDLHEKYLDYTPFIPSVSVLSGTWRVGGVLAMSRAFGNRMLKQFVVAEPEIQVDLATLIVVFSSDETVGGAHVLPCSPSGSKSKNFFFLFCAIGLGCPIPSVKTRGPAHKQSPSIAMILFPYTGMESLNEVQVSACALGIVKS